MTKLWTFGASAYIAIAVRRVGVKQLVAVVVAMFLPFVAATAATPGTAAEEYGQTIAACTAKSDTDAQICLADMIKPVADQLKRTFDYALKVATDEERAAELYEAQVAWTKFSDAQCAFEVAKFQGGTGYWSVGYICRIERTATRIDELKRVARQ